jgi:hypothetical protein
MAYGKTAGCLILAGLTALSAAQFPMRHEHLRKDCAGVMTIDEHGVSFAGPERHSWTWPFQDIRQLKLSSEGVTVLTYDNGRGRFVFRGSVPAGTLYPFLRDRMDQRLVAAIAEDVPGAWSIPVKRGAIAFGADAIVYSTKTPGESRTWRYSDIDTVSSSGLFELTVTTLEKTFHFQLKQPLAEARYDELWIGLQRKNGKIQ